MDFHTEKSLSVLKKLVDNPQTQTGNQMTAFVFCLETQGQDGSSLSRTVLSVAEHKTNTSGSLPTKCGSTPPSHGDSQKCPGGFPGTSQESLDTWLGTPEAETA